MMTITTSSDAGGVETLCVEGRIDTNTSPQLEKALLQLLRTANKVIIDLAGVNYISSAGLRVLLIGQKTATAKRTSLELVHVSQPVMSVLHTVGFSKILTIKS